MNQLERLIQEYASRGILVDANLLLLFVVGETSTRLIHSFKRTSHYTREDHEAVAAVLKAFAGHVITTPTILAEVGNLAGNRKGSDRTALFETFAKTVIVLTEIHMPSCEVVGLPGFVDFGLTDISILGLADRDRLLVLTDDGRLASHLHGNGVDVVTLAELRVYSGLPPGS